jgi:hypothetical protein
MARRLKVFRTPAGFHDAYVAAPSRKAALAAWGADADLFARGLAEEVTDAALMEAPLATPGEVVKRSRGSAEEHLAATPSPRRKAAAKKSVQDKKVTSEKKAARGGTAPARKRPPRPSRAALEAAEAALAEATRRHDAERRDVTARIAALERERRDADRRWETDRAALEGERDVERERYDAAVAKWR